MIKKVVIAGSASLQEKIEYWINFWENRDFKVINYPLLIKKDQLLEKYPKTHKDFFKSIMEADTLFVLNEDRKGIKGYLGAESFAETCFAVTQNLINNKKIKIILLQKPSKEVQSYEEICLWLKLGWISLYK